MTDLTHIARPPRPAATGKRSPMTTKTDYVALADWITAHWEQINADYLAGMTEVIAVKHYVRICACGADRDSARWLQEAVERYRQAIGKREVTA